MDGLDGSRRRSPLACRSSLARLAAGFNWNGYGMAGSNSSSAQRVSRRGRKPVLTEEQKRTLPRLVRKLIRDELRRWLKAVQPRRKSGL
jgi:hypothetical protein